MKLSFQVEGLIDDIDFKAKVTRDEFESMCADLFDRVRGPVDQALASSQMILNEIDQIILVGGGSRVPKLQEKLQEAVKRYHTFTVILDIKCWRIIYIVMFFEILVFEM